MDLNTARLHIRMELGQMRLNRPRAKVEILLGLLIAGLGLLISIRGVLNVPQDYGIYAPHNVPGFRLQTPRRSADGYAIAFEPQEASWLQAAAGLILFVLGGYLALAGHRSHLYQSSNELTAYLAELVRANGQPAG
jgi:hypothetical protein